jgi:hypothetical protein
MKLYVCLFADCGGPLFVCRLRRASPLRPIGDVTEAETHQDADVWSYGDASVRMRTERTAERMPVVSDLLTFLTVVSDLLTCLTR